MSRRQVQVVILCEDDEHESFVRGYLKCRGYNLGKLRVRSYPARGGGSGKEFVRKHYAVEVRAPRKYCTMHQSDTYGLVVLMDQDTSSQRSPYTDLDDRLAERGLDRRQTDERIAILAPKRNIETWAYHLLDNGRPVDEATDYSSPKYHIAARECGRAGTLFRDYDPGNDCPLPSLTIGCGERGRIP